MQMVDALRKRGPLQRVGAWGPTRLVCMQSRSRTGAAPDGNWNGEDKRPRLLKTDSFPPPPGRVELPSSTRLFSAL